MNIYYSDNKLKLLKSKIDKYEIILKNEKKIYKSNLIDLTTKLYLDYKNIKWIIYTEEKLLFNSCYDYMNKVLKISNNDLILINYNKEISKFLVENNFITKDIYERFNELKEEYLKNFIMCKVIKYDFYKLIVEINDKKLEIENKNLIILKYLHIQLFENLKEILDKNKNINIISIDTKDIINSRIINVEKLEIIKEIKNIDIDKYLFYELDKKIILQNKRRIRSFL